MQIDLTSFIGPPPAKLRESLIQLTRVEGASTPSPSDGGIRVDSTGMNAGPTARRMTTHAGGRRGPWESAWLVVLAAVLVAVVAGYGISRVHGYAAERGKLKDLLGELETAAYHESALEWQA